jgi:hypothetical protein
MPVGKGRKAMFFFKKRPPVPPLCTVDPFLFSLRNLLLFLLIIPMIFFLAGVI